MAGEAKKFMDAATEFEVVRVSAPGHAAWAPYPENRALTRKGDMLVFGSGRDGAPQLYRHNFKQNKLKVLTAAAKLNVDSFTLTAGDKSLLFFDGSRLMAGTLNGSKEKEIVSMPAGSSAGLRVAASDEGAAMFVSGGDGARTRIYSVMGKQLSQVAEVAGSISNLTVRPRRMSVTYIAKGRLRMGDAELKSAAGEVLSAQWSADGAAVLYLAKTAGLTELRELNPEEGTDALIAKTSQFGAFHRNGDATVFLGTSMSKAAPYLVLLLRAPVRELPLCEHRSSEARAAFSPNSARMVFQSDRDGKMAVYAMAVDKLVEETDSESQ